jgi:hypothetical protein
MRPRKRRATTTPGQRISWLDNYKARGIYVEFYDPDGTRYGIPTYPFHMVPEGLATLRQLRAKGLRPGGQDIKAQIIWKHGGPSKGSNGTRTTRRVAYLFAESEAKPRRAPTPAQREAIDKALAARRTCPSCHVEQSYYMPRSIGECNRCANPELYRANDADEGWDAKWAEEWDSGRELQGLEAG